MKWRARALLSLATATATAAVVDPILELASNAGVFGHGNFTDHSFLDVIPAGVIAALLLAAVIVLRARATLLQRARAVLTPAYALQSLPLTFALQLLALYSMESLEQYAVYGHLLGGIVWLGAPLVVGLSVHFAGCVLAALGAVTVVTNLTGQLVRVVAALFAFISRYANADHVARATRRVAVRLLHFTRFQDGERAPPLLAR